MNGRQSFLLNDIKTHIRNGGNVTHILNVKISNQPSAEISNRIREAVFRAIGNVLINKVVNGHIIPIMWRTAARTTSAYYHCDAGMFNDIAVKEHTKVLLRDVLMALDDQFANTFTQGITGVAFLLSRPLVREVVLVDDDILPLRQEIGDDDELDEVMENA